MSLSVKAGAGASAPMNREGLIGRLKEARRIVGEVRDRTDLPAVARSTYLADLYLHWALWQLGEVEELIPELE